MAVRAGLKINEYGVFKGPGEKRIGGKKEEDVYKALKLPFIPPELREDTGEIEAALEGKLPDLVTLDDIKGDLHVHTNWSDGSHDLGALVQAAKKKGYSYIAITDHTKGLGVAHGLDEKRLAEEIRLIDEANKKLSGFRVLKGTEIDIRSDGRLDLTDDALAGLDIVVASIHSGFKQTQEQITATTHLGRSEPLRERDRPSHGKAHRRARCLCRGHGGGAEGGGEVRRGHGDQCLSVTARPERSPRENGKRARCAPCHQHGHACHEPVRFHDVRRIDRAAGMGGEEGRVEYAGVRSAHQKVEGLQGEEGKETIAGWTF